MRVCVLTILDNLANNGSLIQATAMLRVFNAEAVVWKREYVWKRFSQDSGKTTLDYYNALNIKNSFTDYQAAADYINSNYDLMIVGSDELWKAGDPSDDFSIPYPNPFWGSGITIKKVALAVSTGSINISEYPREVQKRMAADLMDFDLIYVRDKKSAKDLEKIGVHTDGFLPDPTFAIDLKPTSKFPTDDVDPEEWFSSFGNLDFLQHERMHKLLACLRGGTPCLSYDQREKSIELREQFNLPKGTEHEVRKNWPYLGIAQRCQEYRDKWISIVKEMSETYTIEVSMPSERIHVPKVRFIPASSTYMLDSFRTGRLHYSKGSLKVPCEIWRTKLSDDKPYSAESTAVFDRDGNIYFGCHNGNFYSLNSQGQIRWRFETSIKIYSSPLLIPNSNLVCFASGDGFLYCLNYKGELIWSIKIGGVATNSWWESKLKEYYKKNHHTLHEVNRFETVKSWASPNMLSDGTICICGYDLGLSAVDPQTGELKWRLNLGTPTSHLTGVAVTNDDNIIAVAQQRDLFKVSATGNVLWKRKLKSGLNAWGNPSIEQESNQIYLSVSKREHTSIIYSYDLEGNRLWKRRLPEATRGTISISYENYVICCGFKGNVYFLDKKTGAILKKIKVTDGKMWTSASIDPTGNIFVSVIDSSEKASGRVCCYDKNGAFVWEYEMGKGHSVPIIDSMGRLYLGSWSGNYYCLQT